MTDRMTILDFAERVLREAGGRPLTLSQLAERMFQKGWETKSKDPPGNVGTSLADDVKDRGASSRFVRIRTGEYALSPGRVETSPRAPNHGLSTETGHHQRNDLKKVRSEFASYFKHWNIELPAEAVVRRERGQLFQSGWNVRWLFGRDEKGEYLDFYAAHRMTNDRHLRIHENGEATGLEALPDSFVPVGKEKEYFARNRRIGRMLRAKGF